MLSEAQELILASEYQLVSANQRLCRAMQLLVGHVITKSLFPSRNMTMDEMKLCSVFLNVSCSHVLKVLQRILCDSKSVIENIYNITNEKNAALSLLFSNKERN